MIKTAHELRGLSRNERVVRVEVREILHAMQTEMTVVNKEGRNSIAFAVPKSYTSVGDNPDTVMVIITSVLKELVAGGYTVKIKDLEHSYMFDIRWIIELTDRDRHAMNDLLRKHMDPESSDD